MVSLKERLKCYYTIKALQFFHQKLYNTVLNYTTGVHSKTEGNCHVAGNIRGRHFLAMSGSVFSTKTTQSILTLYL